MNNYDFRRSFLKWTSTRVNHTPRLQVDAACRVTHAGQTMEFFLGAWCIGETMYVSRGLIQLPPYEFAMICAPNDQFMSVKYHADEARNIVEARRVGETMSTHDGKGAGVLEIPVHMAYHDNVRELKAYPQIREAILGNRVLNARTEYLGEDGQTQVVMDYPVKVCNIANDRDRWQVDTGPVLMPDLLAPSELPVGRMRMGYIVFNEWDWAEVTVRRLRPEAGAPPSSHFLQSKRLAVRNSMFCVD